MLQHSDAHLRSYSATVIFSLIPLLPWVQTWLVTLMSLAGKSPSLTFLWHFTTLHWFWSILCFMGSDANVKTVNPALRGSISHTCRLRLALCLNFLRITSCLWKLCIYEDISASLTSLCFDWWLKRAEIWAYNCKLLQKCVLEWSCTSDGNLICATQKCFQQLE